MDVAVCVCSFETFGTVSPQYIDIEPRDCTAMNNVLRVLGTLSDCSKIWELGRSARTASWMALTSGRWTRI